MSVNSLKCIVDICCARRDRASKLSTERGRNCIGEVEISAFFYGEYRGEYGNDNR